MTQELSRRMVVGGLVATTTAFILPIRASAQGATVGRRTDIVTNGGKFDAYLSAPSTGKGPAVVIVPTIFGIDQDMKNICDSLAQRGYTTLAWNPFWHDEDPGVLSLPADMKRATARAFRIDFEKSMGDHKRAIAEAKRHPNCNGKVAVLGFCLGGPYVWRSACDGLGIDAGVSFFGTFVSKYMKPGDKPSCPVAFHYGDKDELAPPAELEAVKKVADATGCQFIVHPGVSHGYLFPSAGPGYNPEVTRQTWDSVFPMIDALRT